jgi:hypothetical protein
MLSNVPDRSSVSSSALVNPDCLFEFGALIFTFFYIRLDNARDDKTDNVAFFSLWLEVSCPTARSQFLEMFYVFVVKRTSRQS